VTPEATDTARRWPLLVVLLLGAASCAVYLMPIGVTAQAAVYQLVGVGTAAAAFAGARRHPRGHRLPWILLATGLLVQTAGDAIWNWIELVRHDEVAFPAVPDLLYLSGYPLWTLACALLVRRVGIGRTGAFLDTLVLAGGASALGYHFLIGPYLNDTSSTVLQRVVGAAYPAMDLLLFVGAVLIVTSSAARGRPALRLLTVAFAVGFAGDGTYGLLQLHGDYASGDPIDLAWIVQYWLVAAAAWAGRPGAAAPPEVPVAGRPPRWRVPALFVAALIGPVELVLVIGADPAEAGVLACGTVALVALVATRMSGLLRQVSRQADSLRSTLAERDRISDQLRRHAEQDDLTGLANRHLVSRHGHQLLRASPAGPHAVIFLDLDGFRAVNERFGHPGGDALLQEVAGRLRSAVRPGEQAARLGGDEFVVLLPDTELSTALARAGELLGEITAPVRISGRPVAVTASAGVAPMPVTSGPEEAYHSALADADLAMFAAKQAGGGQVEEYHAGLREELLGAAELGQELAEAIAADGLDIAFQPLVGLGDGRLTGMEALVRWHHPRRGTLQPAEFLPVALDRGLIDDLDLLVLGQGLAQLAAWRARHPAAAPPRLNVNVSAPLLARPDLVPTVQLLLARHSLPGSALALELTEQVLVDDPGTCAQRLHELAALGVTIALDDFGTGYSSLAYLGRFPVRELKLDRTFIGLGTAGGQASKLLCAVLELARTLGLTVVAEGIEDDRQRELLTELGCDVGQGYLFARPMPAAQAEQWFAEQARLRLPS
jgi:diguanylate cyclase (GGDEF)-like protein